MSSFLAAWAVLGFACTVEEENPASPMRNRGTDSGADGTATVGEGDAPPAGAPLCGKYGGADGVKAIATAILDSAKADCRISPVVSEDVGQQRTQECWSTFVGSSFMCPGVSFTYTATTDSKGQKCNSQLPGVQFSNLDFNAFLQDVQATLKAKGLTDDDIKAIAPAFEGGRAKLATGNVPNNKYTQCAANCTQGGESCIRIIDAGKETGAGDTGTGDTGAGGGDTDADAN